MRKLRFSIRELLMLTALVALGLALAVQHWRYREAESLYQDEVGSLRNRLHATQQVLGKLPVNDPERACVLATPSFAYARWAWRIYLPPGSRYTLHIDVGHVVEDGSVQRISTDEGCSQHMSLPGNGETVVIVEQIPWGEHRLLGASVGRHESNCRLTPEVARCLAKRLDFQEEQLGAAGTVGFAADRPIHLLMRWYPGANASADGKTFPGPAGFSVWLEPF